MEVTSPVQALAQLELRPVTAVIFDSFSTASATGESVTDGTEPATRFSTVTGKSENPCACVLCHKTILQYLPSRYNTKEHKVEN